MERDRVDDVVAFLEDYAVPFEVRRHARPARAAGDELQVADRRRASAARRRPPFARTPRPSCVRSARGRPSRCRDRSASRSRARRHHAGGEDRSTAFPTARCRYSTSAAAFSAVPVPKLRPRSGSVPTARHQARNSFVPNWFVSTEFHARSRTVGREAAGPTPSSQSYPETKLPPGIARSGRSASALRQARRCESRSDPRALIRARTRRRRSRARDARETSRSRRRSSVATVRPESTTTLAVAGDWASATSRSTPDAPSASAERPVVRRKERRVVQDDMAGDVS